MTTNLIIQYTAVGLILAGVLVLTVVKFIKLRKSGIGAGSCCSCCSAQGSCRKRRDSENPVKACCQNSQDGNPCGKCDTERKVCTISDDAKECCKDNSEN